MRSRLKNHIILLTALFLFSFVLSSSCSAFSMSPGHSKIFFEPGKEETISFTINNYDTDEDRLFMLRPFAYERDELRGMLDDVVTIHEPEVVVPAGIRKRFTVDITLPQELSPGRHEIQINVRREEPDQNAMVGAVTSLAYRILIYVPYPGKYVETELYEPDDVSQGETVNFKIKAHNLGTDRIESIYADVKIMDESGAAATATSVPRSLEPEELATLTAPLDTSDISVGSYSAKAVVYFDGESKETNEVDFNIGDLIIEIQDISESFFESGKISRFDISILSKWNERLERVYGNINLHKGGLSLYSTKTETVSASPWQKTTIPAFIDTTGITPGAYDLEVRLDYENVFNSRNFKVEITEPSAVEEPKQAFSVLVLSGIIIAVIIIIFLMNVLFFLYLKKEDKEPDE